jgi:hypothetical protein
MQFLTPGVNRFYRLQYLTLAFPHKWELTWGGLRRRPQEDKKAKKYRALYEKVRLAAKEMGIDMADLRAIEGRVNRDRSKARYDDANEEVN